MLSPDNLPHLCLGTLQRLVPGLHWWTTTPLLRSLWWSCVFKSATLRACEARGGADDRRSRVTRLRAILINNEMAVKAGAKNRQQPVDLIAAIVSVIQPHSYTVTGFFLCRRSCNLAENERRRKPALRAEAVEGAEDAERRGRAALRNGIIGGIKRILHRRSNLEFRPRPNCSRISLSSLHFLFCFFFFLFF